jgi:hypothetical protein
MTLYERAQAFAMGSEPEEIGGPAAVHAGPPSFHIPP